MKKSLKIGLIASLLTLGIAGSPMAPAGKAKAAASPDAAAMTPYEGPYVDLYENPDGAINGSTYIFNPDANFRERMVFDFKRMKEATNVNAIGFYNIVQMTDADRDALFDALEKNRQKAIIRIEAYDGSTFDWDNNDPAHSDAVSVINHYNTNDPEHGYTALLDYLKANDRLKDVAYFAVNMPVDDGAVADHFKNALYSDGRANPEWSSSQVAYADDLMHRLRDILGDSSLAKLYLSVFYGWDFAYHTPSYADIAHKADGYFLNNYSYPAGSPPDETASASERINQPRLQQGMDRFMAQYPDAPKIIEYGFHTSEFNHYNPTSQTAGLVKTAAAKRLALKDTTAFYKDGSSGGKSFNVRGTLYFAQNLYKEEGNPLTVSDWTLDYPSTAALEAEDPLAALSDAVISEDAEASGGKLAELAAEGMTVQFFNVNAASLLKVRYSAAADTTLSFYINGSFQERVSFPATNGWGEMYIHANVPLLGSAKFLRDTGDGAVKLDSLQAYSYYEAEADTETNGSLYQDAAASGGQGVTLPAEQGSYLEIGGAGVKPGTRLLIHYASESDAKLALYVNGSKASTLTFEGTNDAYVSSVIPMSIPAHAKLKLVRETAGSGQMNIDYLQVNGDYEAEFASGLYNGAHGFANPAASGSGVAADLDFPGASTVFNGVVGGKQLKIRYSGTQDNSMTVYIGGQSFNVSFPSTGSSSAFREVYINSAIPNDATIVIQRNGNNSAAGLQLDSIASLGWYEAESAVLGGAAAVAGDAAAYSGKQAVVSGTGDSVQFPSVAGGSQLQVRYSAAADALLALYVNGRHMTDVRFPATGALTGAYKSTTANADIPAGAAVKLQADSGTAAVGLDSVSVIEKNEAETANLIGGASVYADIKASGEAGADLAAAGDGVEFTNVKAGNKLLVRYAGEADGKLALYVNGARKKDVVFPANGVWKGAYNVRPIDADIPAGAAVKLVCENGGSRVRVDNLDVAGIVEAENSGTVSDGVALQDDRTASGGAAMTGFAADGSFIAFTNKNGAGSVSVRYKSNTDASFTVYAKYRNNVDDASVYKTDTLGVIGLPATGGGYRTAVLNAYIRDGMQIILKKEAGNAADDSLIVDYAGFSDKMEAEAAVVGGGAAAHYEGEASPASAQGQVIATGGEGAYVQFDHVKAANRVIIGYTNEAVQSASRFSLYVAKPGEDFKFAQKITFVPTGSWSGPFAERALDIDIPSGSRIKLQNDGNGDTPVHFDYIKLTGVYEAENGNFYGNARTWYNAVTEPNGPSGSYWAWAFADIGDAVEVQGVRGGNEVRVRYSEGENPGTNGQLGLFVNGAYKKDIVMPYTGSWGKYEVIQTDERVADGSVIKLQNTKQTDHTAPIDYMEIRDKQREAENANLYGQAAVVSDGNAMYGYAVHGLGAAGDSLELPGMNAGSRLVVKYASAADGTLSLYVNGMKKGTVSFPATAEGAYATVSADVEIPAGAVVSLKHDSGDTFAPAAAIDSAEAAGNYASDNRYEAEDGQLNGVEASADANASGSWKVNALGDGAAVTLSEVKGGKAILVRYAAAESGELKLYVNGEPNGTAAFPATSGAWSWLEMKAHIPGNASIELRNEGAAETVSLDAFRISDKYEAEYSVMNGESNDGIKPGAYNDASASNGQGAARLWAPDNGSGSFEFPGASAGTELEIAYASGDSNNRKLTLYMNNEKVQSVVFPAYEGGGWDGKYNTVSVRASIPEGAAIKLQKDAGDSEVNLDYVKVKGIYEAEDAELSGSAFVSADQASRGLSVGGINTPASGVTFRNVIAGNTAYIRYASQGEGTLYLYVNGGSKKKVVFPDTGGYTGTYGVVSVPVSISAGDSVQLVFEAKPGENPVSLDNLTIRTDNDQTAGNGLTVTSTVAGLSLLVNYSSTADGQMSLYVDGAYKRKLLFPDTQGAPQAKEFKIAVPAGVEVKLQDDGKPDVPVNLIDMAVSDKYEAEYAKLFGVDGDGHATSPFVDGPASNGQAVHFIWADGSYLEFPDVIAGNRFTVGYSGEEAGRHLSLYVNGEKKTDIVFANTGGWTGHYEEVTVPVDIPEGAAIKIQRDPGDSDVIIDYIQVTTEGAENPDPGTDPGDGGDPGTSTPPSNGNGNPSPVPVNGTVELKPVAQTGDAARAELSSSVLAVLLSQAKADQKGVKTIKVSLSAVGSAKAYTVDLPKELFSAAGQLKADKKVELATPAGTMVIPNNMFSSSELQVSGKVSLSLAEANVAGLPAEAKDRIGSHPMVELTAMADGKVIAWNNPDAPVTVGIDYKPTAEELKNPERIVIWYVDGAGKLHPVPSGRYDPATGQVMFTTTHFSKYAVAYAEVAFNDISSAQWASQAIEAMTANGVMNGASVNAFGPSAPITRAEFIDGLMKALGLTAKFDANFADMETTDSYYETIGTARSLGISNGTGNDKFQPNSPITRQEMSSFVVRALKAAGKLDASAAGSASDLNGFKDSASIAKYAVEDMATLVKAGILIGSGGRIDPRGNVTKAQTAVVLYRIFTK
ncbi:S-layer homology domain-containing protein [Paenibacillus sp. BK720]|uniref:S-layer homology domain-containing protein n=1 Tax=Paenibacillus sp. BK720 TaxID=2587092 RepID=UPI001FB9890E|nr:S-layer homology domain-containing protein [Paenibacillus sp. BK720]